jgi:hypothetical protein
VDQIGVWPNFSEEFWRHAQNQSIKITLDLTLPLYDSLMKILKI